ncbi:hypothetical protein F8M41_010191 [Gigaspora margarita]|uniref:Uncharacterized protein n=1 Tax=Gigaspora margarita TaxID=4874 RepID=A0A8H4A1G5_GIGMA|nr:hypothetical protein F8M41_010191 [Gigaspora margarita]
MVDYKNIELALIERKRDPEDHVKYVAKQRALNEKTYNKNIVDFKNWYNEKIYTSLEKLYKLYLEIANQEEKVEKRTKLQVDEILQKIHVLKI